MGRGMQEVVGGVNGQGSERQVTSLGLISLYEREPSEHLKESGDRA